MTEQPTTFRARMHALVTPPGLDDDQRWMRVWVHVWRTLVVACTVLAAIALGWALIAALLVGAPHAIVTGTLGKECVSDGQLDCFRAIADARQSVLFSAGGLIALVGILFTYLKWRAERDSADEAVHEGRRATERHLREIEQVRLSRITETLELLRSEDAEVKVAALRILGALTEEYADHDDRRTYTFLILDVIVAMINRACATPATAAESAPDPIDPVTSYALRVLLSVTSQKHLNVTLFDLTLVKFNGSGTDWSRISLNRVSFENCDLDGCIFAPSLTYADTDAGRGPELSSVRFVDCDLGNTTFDDSRLWNVQFHSTKPVEDVDLMESASFTNALLTDVTFLGFPWPSMTFGGATLDGVTFAADSPVGSGAFLGANMEYVRFGYTGQHGPLCMVDAEGTHFLPLGTVDCGLITSVALHSHASIDQGPADGGGEPRHIPRDSGETAGDSRTPDPTQTDESPT